MHRNAMTSFSALFSLVAIGSASFAVAADMPAPPPPVPMFQPAQNGYEQGSGFYLRGDIGTGVYDSSKLEYTNRPAAAANYSWMDLNNSIGNSAVIGVGVGYQMNSWLRGDVTAEYRTAAKMAHTEFQQPSPAVLVPVAAGSNVTAQMSSMVVLANAYLDLGTWNRITPFVGAGIGLASTNVHKAENTSFGGSSTTSSFKDKSKTNMAWAIHAGLGYDLANNLKAEVAYRYTNYGDVASGVCASCASDRVLKAGNLTSHDMKVGMRYIFADAAQSMAQPLVRRY